MSSKTPPLSYRQLPAFFYRDVDGAEFETPEAVAINFPLGKSLGLTSDWLTSKAGQDVLSGRSAIGGGSALAMTYGGHQFGHWSGMLGDGRARLVGEVQDAEGAVHELHLKGAGLTPFSRGGDGKATLGSAIREYIVSEAMAALGVPTTRALSVVTTGETIIRKGAEPAAILCRSARSHIRVGTFQIAAAAGDNGDVKALADFAIDRLYPDAPAEGPARYSHFLRQVIASQARLIATWMGFGFIHGVMNTDNATISGETIDYGPCAFMDEFHPGKVFSSIDRNGRYAWNKQPEMAHWNMVRLAESLLLLLGETAEEQQSAAEVELDRFAPAFSENLNRVMVRKLGVQDSVLSSSDFLAVTIEAMTVGHVDYTLFFRALTRLANGGDADALLSEFSDIEKGAAWLESWKAITEFDGRLSAPIVAQMRQANPIYIPRNHRVEDAIADANTGNLGSFKTLMEVVTQPFTERAEFAEYENPPRPDEIVRQTFCGT